MSGSTHTGAVEIVMYRVRPGVGDDQIIALSDIMQTDVERFPGYIGRRLLKSEDGLWLDIVDWASMEEALNAATQFSTFPAAQQFGELADVENVAMYHLAPVREYTRETTPS